LPLRALTGDPAPAFPLPPDVEVIAVTLFFSTLLGVLFTVLFFLRRGSGKSSEQQSLLPLEDDDPVDLPRPDSRRLP